MNLLLKKTNEGFYRETIENMKDSFLTSEIIYATLFSFALIFVFGIFGIMISAFIIISLLVRQKTLIPISDMFTPKVMGKSQYYTLCFVLVIFISLGLSNAKYNIEYRLDSLGITQNEEQQDTYLRNIDDTEETIKDTTEEKETLKTNEKAKEEIEFSFSQLFGVNYLANIIILWCINSFAAFFLKFYVFKTVKGFDNMVDVSKFMRDVYSPNHKKTYYFNTLFALSIFSFVAILSPIICYTLMTVYGCLYVTSMVYNHLYLTEKENSIIVGA